MNLKIISSESSYTGTSTDARWLKGNDQLGYLGIPMDNKKDIYTRDLLCKLQNYPHIPIMERVGIMDGYVWYKTEFLEPFWKFHFHKRNPWSTSVLLHQIKTELSGIDYVDEQIESVNKTLQIIAKEIEEAGNEYRLVWDIKNNDNIRIRQDGTLMLCDVLI